MTATDLNGVTSAAATTTANILPAELQGTTLAVGGTTGNDLVVFNPGAAPGQWSVTVNGSKLGTFQPAAVSVFDNGGTDTVTVNGTSQADAFTLDAADVVVNGLTISADSVSSWRLAGQGGNDTFTVNAADKASLDGGTGTDTLIGPDALNQWQLTGLDKGTLDSTVFFSNMENLTGGSGTDKFHIVTGGALAGTIDGGGGSNDTLDDSGFGTATIDLQSGTATGIGAFANISALVGAGSLDTLIGPDAGVLWKINNSNTGLAGSFWFGNVANLVGGAGSDTFKFANGKGVTGTLDGGGGSNVLDYSSYTSGLTVNLATGSATGVQGGVQNVQVVLGGSGNDTLSAGSTNAILLGGAGDDVLTGGSGRALVIGGLGVDQLTAGSGDAILIAGTTSFDLAALEAILAEWARTDESYSQRISHIHGFTTGGLNGSYYLQASTVQVDSSGSDTLTGGGGADWFWANVAVDIFVNKKSWARVN